MVGVERHLTLRFSQWRPVVRRSAHRLEGHFDELNKEIGVVLHLSIQVRRAELLTTAQERVVLPLQHGDSTSAEVITLFVERLEQRGDPVSNPLWMPGILARVLDPLLQITGGGFGILGLRRVIARAEGEEFYRESDAPRSLQPAAHLEQLAQLSWESDVGSTSPGSNIPWRPQRRRRLPATTPAHLVAVSAAHRQ